MCMCMGVRVVVVVVCMGVRVVVVLGSACVGVWWWCWDVGL